VFAKTSPETVQMLKQSYGEDCLSPTQCYKRYHFKSGTMSTEDDPKTGSPSTSTDDHVEKVCVVIRENRHQSMKF
jgi:hypothetical protein